MSDVKAYPMVYVPGSLVITRQMDGRFTLEGNYQINGTHTADHFQLIYEALEIAAYSNDKFKTVFRSMCDELLDLTAHWDN